MLSRKKLKIAAPLPRRPDPNKQNYGRQDGNVKADVYHTELKHVKGL